MRLNVAHMAQALRPPDPRLIRDAAVPASRAASARIAVDRDITSTIDRLATLGTPPAHASTLILPSRGIGPRAVLGIVRWMAQASGVTLGLSRDVRRTERRRWFALGETAGVAVVVLGDRGWDRVRLGDISEFLGYVDLPAELSEFDGVVVARASLQPVMSAWHGIVHPNSAMRASASGPPGDAELSLACEGRYITLGRLARTVVAIDSDDRVAAELVVAAIARVVEEVGGIEAQTPWEESQVQDLVALAGGIVLPSQLTIRASVATATSAHAVIRLAELIGCRLEWSDGQADVDIG